MITLSWLLACPCRGAAGTLVAANRPRWLANVAIKKEKEEHGGESKIASKCPALSLDLVKVALPDGGFGQVHLNTTAADVHAFHCSVCLGCGRGLLDASSHVPGPLRACEEVEPCRLLFRCASCSGLAWLLAIPTP